MKELLIATRNPNKTKQFSTALANLYAVCDLTDFPEMPEVEESGATFRENAELKALGASRYTGDIVLADDSGLCVDALGGEPGIYSARYSGENATDSSNNELLLKKLNQASVQGQARTARYQCCIVLAQREKVLHVANGTVEGQIAERPRGSGGFGYDPLFIPEGYTQTFAELPTEIKMTFSHRGKALALALQYLKTAASVR